VRAGSRHAPRHAARWLGALKTVVLRTGEETHNIRGGFRALLRRVPRARNLLDVGCGDGHATQLYASTWGIPLADVVGVEAQDKYRAPGHPFRVCAVDVERERLPFPDRSFDVVVCNQVLEHLKTVIGPLREMMRVTQTGGFIAVGIPNLASLASRIYLLLGRDPICLAFPGPHVRGLTHRSFGRMLRSNPNLSLEAVSGAVFYPAPLGLGEPLARAFPGLACYTFYLARKIRHRPDDDWPQALYPDESLTG
jgi:SAM-dependent methyltransferase